MLYHGCSETVAVYRCANKQVTGRAAYTNTPPAGALRGNGISQTNFAIESVIDELAHRLRMSPAELRAKNMVGPDDALIAFSTEPNDIAIGSYGLGQCLAMVRDALARPGDAAPAGWCEGSGLALSMLDTVPPNGHRATSHIRALPDGSFALTVGTAEFGNGTTTVHAQIAAAALGTTPDRIAIAQSDTANGGHDTGAYGSTGVTVAGLATLRAAEALRDGTATEAVGHATGTPRSVSFNVQGFRVAVHRASGAVRILRSVHAADAGTVINPMQCRGEVEGGVAQAIGAALYEDLIVGPDGGIESVDADEMLPRTADEALDPDGHILLPGLVNCHHHLDQTLTRNLPGAQNAELFDWLAAHYQTWARRTPEASRTVTLVGLAELALCGCTTAFDHAYVFRNGCAVDDQIAAAAEIGMRFMVSRGSMSRGQSQGGLPPDACVETEPAILADCERVIARYHDPSPGAMTRIVLAPCSPFSITDRLMRDSAALARRHGVRLHTRLCKTADEQAYTLAHHGVRPVEYMRALDWVADDVWFAHPVHVNDAEIGLFARAGTGVHRLRLGRLRHGRIHNAAADARPHRRNQP